MKPFRAYLVDCAGVPEGSDCEEYFENQSEPSYVSRYRFADVLAPANSAENSLSAEKQAGTATNQPLVMRVSAANETASLNAMDYSIIKQIEEHSGAIFEGVERMTEARHKANRQPDERSKAVAYHDTVLPLMAEIRDHADALELIVDDELWTLPKYRELMFIH